MNLVKKVAQFVSEVGRNVKRVGFALLALFVGLLASNAKADGDPVAGAVSTIQTTLTGYAGTAITAMIVCATAGLGIWGLVWIIGKIKKGASAGAR